MNHKKTPVLVTALVAGLSVLTSAASVFADQVVDYKIAVSDDGKTYEVWMRPELTPSPDISLTGQVTLKVPSTVKFSAKEVVSSVEGADWIEASRVNSPEEDPEHDYISFSYIGVQGDSARSYGWKGEEEKLVFTFSNEGGCVDGISIMADDDPFNVPENSANTNPGNQFTNLGWGAVGENNFKGVYGSETKCK